MPLTTLDGYTIHVDTEGFMTDMTEWTEPLGKVLGRQIGLELTDEHLTVLRQARDDFAVEGESPTLRRMSTVCGVPIKQLFVLFPQKPAKKIAYVAGLPKPRGCV